MKTFLPFLAVCALFPAAGTGAAEDCAKSADACRPQPASLTPFMAELKKAVRAPELKQPPAKDSGVKERVPGAAPKIPAPVAAAVEAPLKKETLSRPGWLAAAALFVYGLYHFLKEGKKKKR